MGWDCTSAWTRRPTSAPSALLGLGTDALPSVVTRPLPLPRQRREYVIAPLSLGRLRGRQRPPTRLPSESLNHALASTGRPGNAVLCPCLRCVVLLELDTANPHFCDDRAHVADLNYGLREFPRRPLPSWIDEESVDTISHREAHPPIACLEKFGLDRLESHLVNVERLGSSEVLCWQRRSNPRRPHEYLLCR